DDIVPIAKHFLLEFSNKFAKKFTGISLEAEEALMAYRWTGNVRELKNLIERAVLIGTEPVLEIEDLGIEGVNKAETLKQGISESAFPPLPAKGIDLTSVQKALEKFYIEEALKIAGGNESKAARLLNINHHTFRYRRKKLQIQ
ncbi:MAG: sigma-54-dependent Fis family transcriptional regulator, partial [Deltaproteobacteria bacterium]|nr:sigma-54-dependent Fis family transcriptional regulator [Deltaproteobacteria bacterium]